MSTVELYNPDIWPIASGAEPSSEHYGQIRKNIWLAEHLCAGNIDTTEMYGKWVGNASEFEYVEYNRHNWTGWNPGTDYHFGSPIVKYRWGTLADEVDIFVFNADDTPGDMLDQQLPIIAGKLNSNFWLLCVDPNKYAHWNKNAGRPDIGADARWIISHHGYIEPPDGPGWTYGRWEAWRELPTHTNPFEQIPHVKVSNVDSARHHPVGPKMEYITKNIRPTLQRSYHDGTIGTEPWIHSQDADKVSEYARVSGDPVGSLQIGPSYIDSKYIQALQDRVIHCLEINYGYLVEVDQFFKDRWQQWNTYGNEIEDTQIVGCVNRHSGYAGQYKGTYTLSRSYQLGDVVYWNYYWWRCIKYLAFSYSTTAPGEPGGAEYWANSAGQALPLHQPDYIPSDPLYVQFSDYLHTCNSSAYEKVLKNIGHFDWWWDDRGDGGFPTVPWWMYQEHYYKMTEHRADPDAGHAKMADERYPLPRGCWRRVWRYTMCWDHDRDEGQKARLGKIIDIDGQKVSMMWPGELGNPPGYDELLFSVGEIGGVHYDYKQFAHAVTQQQYDAMDRPVGEETKYTRYYVVVDVEELFKEAYRNNSSIESRIKERHDPLATEWLYDDGGVLKEYPIYEIYPDLVNDVKDALLQLNLFQQQTTITKTDYRVWAELGPYSNSLDAYTAGKHLCDAETGATANAGIYGNVGYVGLVRYNIGGDTYQTWGTVTTDYYTEKCWTEVTITRDVDVCFPAKEVGTLIFDILARNSTGQSVNTPCAIGAGSFTFTPPADDTDWHRAYVGQVPATCEQVHDGAGDEAGDWTLQCKFRIEPCSPWPDEAYFNFDGPSSGSGKDLYNETEVDVTTGSNLAIAWELDINGFDESVFEEDKTNFIEVT